MINAIECAFSGKLGKAPSIRTSAAGNRWMSFPVAVGNDDDTEWVSVAVFGDTIDQLAHLEVGARVYVEGRLRLNRYEKDGEQRSSLNVAASLVQPMGQIGKRKPQRPRHDAPAPNGGNGYALERTSERGPMPDDPIPF